MALQQIDHRECGERGHQRRPFLPNVSAILDGLHCGGVGRRSADPAFFQFLDEGGFGVACLRLCLMSDRIHTGGEQGLIAFQR